MQVGILLDDFSRDQCKWLALQSRHCEVLAGQLYRKCADGILRRCVPDHEQEVVLAEAHEGIGGGHFAEETTAQTVLSAGL